MGFPARQYQPDPGDADDARPVGPVLIEDEVNPETAPYGDLLPPRRIPPGISGTYLEPEHDPRSVSVATRGHVPGVANYLVFLPMTVASVFLVIIMSALVGVLSLYALSY